MGGDLEANTVNFIWQPGPLVNGGNVNRNQSYTRGNGNGQDIMKDAIIVI